MRTTTPRINNHHDLFWRKLAKLSPVFLPSIVLSLALFFPFTAKSQTAIKSNLLGDALAMPNIGGEVSLSNHSTIALNLRYAPAQFSEEHKWKHWAVAPEYRYWPFAPFRRWYVGGDAFVAGYNVAGMPFYGLKHRRKQGNLYGGAVTGGFAWQLTPRWNLEAGLGLGVAYTDFDKFDYGKCGYPWGKKNGLVFGVTQVGVTLSYVIRRR